MRIYDITFSIRNSESPFKIEYSFGHSSGDIIIVWNKFYDEFMKFLNGRNK